MVKLHVKKGDQSIFFYETTTSEKIRDLLDVLIKIHNGKLKIERLCYEIEELSKFGVSFPPNMQGLTSEQVSELNLKDDWALKNLIIPECVMQPDPMGKRNGFAPSEKYAEVLIKTISEAQRKIPQKISEQELYLTTSDIQDTLDILKGAIQICYPMGLPNYEIIKLELEGKEDLSGTQASKEILQEGQTDLWWASKNLEESKFLSDYAGKNEKCKLVVKLQKRGYGAPAREPVLTEQQRKDLMVAEFHRREELKKLTEDEDDSFLDARWADMQQMKKSFLGLNTIKFK